MFRKNVYVGGTLIPSSPVVEIQALPKNVSRKGLDSQIIVETPVNLSSFEALRNLPNPEDYTLDKLLDAGVPLHQVDSMSFSQDGLDSTLESLDSSFKVEEPTEN